MVRSDWFTNRSSKPTKAYSSDGACPYDAPNWQRFSMDTMGWVVIDNFTVAAYQEPTTTTSTTTEEPTTTSTTTTTTTTTTDAIIDCEVDNGGCSHHCNKITAHCECPTCWSLMKDQRTCAPSVAESLLTCKSEAIDIGLRTVFILFNPRLYHAILSWTL